MFRISELKLSLGKRKIRVAYLCWRLFNLKINAKQTASIVYYIGSSSSSSSSTRLYNVAGCFMIKALLAFIGFWSMKYAWKAKESKGSPESRTSQKCSHQKQTKHDFLRKKRVRWLHWAAPEIRVHDVRPDVTFERIMYSRPDWSMADLPMENRSQNLTFPQLHPREFCIVRDYLWGWKCSFCVWTLMEVVAENTTSVNIYS